MSIFGRMKNAWNAFSGDQDGFKPAGAGSLTNPIIQPGADDRWMGISAYFACIRNICEDVGKLPLITYKRLERGKERAHSHPLYDVLRMNPHPSIGAMAFREAMTRHALGWGNGYAKILRRGNAEAYALEPVHPSFVTVKPDDGGKVKYQVRRPGNADEVVSGADMLHLHGISTDGVSGLSIAELARETLEFAGSAQTFGRNLFARGGRPAGVLKHPKSLTKPQKDELREQWDSAYGGRNAGARTAILDLGVEYEGISINPVDAQYLETRQFSVEEIARWFRMPLHKIQYLVRAQGWSTLDAQNTDYLTDTLSPWLIRWEEEINRKLFAGDKDHFSEHLVNGLLRGDQRARSSFYVSQFSIGALSINEIREFENMNPIEGDGGDKHFVPLNMTPAEFANSVTGGAKTEKRSEDNADDANS